MENEREQDHPTQKIRMSKTSKTRNSSRFRRLLRPIAVTIALLLLARLFGRVGVLDKLDTVVSDVESRLNPVPTDNTVVIVNIGDRDYDGLFNSTSPLNSKTLFGLNRYAVFGRSGRQ
jgi:CHASE2 domain-containing sensor protein